MVSKTLAIVSFVFACLNASATTWYAAEGGSSTNGTLSLPWSISYSVTNSANNPHLQAGDTVVLVDGGTHTCTETNSFYSVGNVLNFRRPGLPGSPITYRPQTLWGFRFNGGLMLEKSTLAASNIVLWGLHITCNLTTNRTLTNSTGYYIPSGITEDGEGNSILHCLIENTGHPGIASWKGTRGKNIRGNVIRFVGYDDWILFSGGNRGSAMYLQNADNSSEALIDGNITYFNYTTGMKAYGNTDIWKFKFSRNIITENAEAGIFYHLDNYASSNLVVSTNLLWRNGTGIRIGYPLGNGGHSNAAVTWNYSVDNGYSAYPFYLVDGWRNVTFSNNIGVTLVDRYGWFLEVSGETSGDVASHKFGANTYYGTNTGIFGAGPFFINESFRTLANWQSVTTTDPDATHTYAMPTAISSYVFRPSMDSNFVHVAVFNWPISNSISVDLSGFGFNTGDQLSVYDAQNIPTAYKTEFYSGTPVALDLTLTNRATMNGTFSQRSSQWSGFDTRFRAFLIYRSTFGSTNRFSTRIAPGRFRKSVSR